MSKTQSGIGNRGKKRRESFLSKAKKFAKKGKFGRGSHIDEEKYQYFLRVLEMNKDENFQTDEERGLFVNNVLEDTEGMEIDYSCNQLASRVIENLLDWANSSVLSRYLRVFGEDLRPMFCDQFASHVLQKLVVIAAARGANTTEENGSKDSSEVDYLGWLSKVARYALNNLEEFVWDTYANQVARTIIECLAGLPPRSTYNSKEVPSSVAVGEMQKEILLEFGNRVTSWPHLPDMVFTDLTAAFLQTLLQALRVKNKKLTRSLVRKLLDECLAVPKSTDDTKDIEDTKDCAPTALQLLPVFSSAPASRVLDVAIMVASSKLRTQIYARCFINKMLLLSKLPISNFCVQRLLGNHKSKEEFEAMYDELGPHMEELLASGNTGVLLSLGQACLQLATKQGSFMQHLMEALQCKNEQEFVPQVLQLTNTKKLDDSLTIHIHGSVLIQVMLRFNKPIKIVSSLLAMTSVQLRDVLSDPKGCHITDAFMGSEHVGEKSRDKLVAALKDQYVKLACSKHGSRSVDAIWKAANLKMKLRIVKELADKEAVLNSNQYGHFVSQKVGVGLFKHQEKEWKDAQAREFSKRKLFADIINENVS